MPKKWKHDELADDLAIAKGGIPFLNVCLGSSWAPGSKTPRADLLVCRPSYEKFIISIYEIKVTRSDFLSDIRTGKWRYYLPHCDRFYFAVPPGVLELSDIPDDAGLVIRNPKGWYTRKTAPKIATEIHPNTLKALEKRLKDRSWSRRDYSGRLKAARVLGKTLGPLHEAAITFGGIEAATQFLKNTLLRVFQEFPPPPRSPKNEQN